MMTSSPVNQLVEVAERLVVADAMPGDDHVAQCPGHRRAGPMAGPVIERGQGDALVDRLADADLRDLDRAELNERLGCSGIGGRALRVRQRVRRGRCRGAVVVDVDVDVLVVVDDVDVVGGVWWR